MLASVHLADVGARGALGALRRAPDPSTTPGLRSANVGLATPLRTQFLPSPAFGRVGLVTFWDDDASLDAFEAAHASEPLVADGWRARLVPLRAYGRWPGLDTDVPKQRRVEYDGPALVLTLGRLRWSQAVRFLRTSQKAEAATANAPGLIWATALARPPFVSTCSVWEDATSLAAYAFDDKQAGHPMAISQDRARPFHHIEAFIRFRPTQVRGSLPGKNPLDAEQLTIA
jgi:hypothetical protein